MENNFKYFNAFFIIIILILLVGLFKYFFYETKEKNTFNYHSQKKYLNKNYIDHIMIIPDNYYYIKTKQKDNFNNEYNLLINKLFIIISESLKYNIHIISINFISLTDLLLMNEKEIINLIDNQKLWKSIEKYANKMNLKINFIYNESITHPDLITIFKNLKTKTNNKKYNNQINFIFGYDLFYDIKKNFLNLINISKDRDDLIDKLNHIDIEKLLLHKTSPIDLTIIFNHANINDNLLLHMKNSKIVNLNYSLENITKKIINLLLKEFLINLHPFL